ncbi:MAG: hypothetical protein ABFC80_02630 [Coriobacteriales bacterium]
MIAYLGRPHPALDALMPILPGRYVTSLGTAHTLAVCRLADPRSPAHTCMAACVPYVLVVDSSPGWDRSRPMPDISERTSVERAVCVIYTERRLAVYHRGLRRQRWGLMRDAASLLEGVDLG